MEPSADGHSLKAVWKRWALVGAKPGQPIDPQITSEVTWHINGTTLTREETLTAANDMAIKRWWVAVPATGSEVSQTVENGQRVDRFDFNDGKLEVAATENGKSLIPAIVATGNS